MNKDRPTLAVYGIQDRTGAPFPWFVHDHAIVLMHKGRVLKALTLERQTRIKHDNSLHKRIYDNLKSEGLVADRNYDLVFVDNVAAGYHSLTGEHFYGLPTYEPVKDAGGTVLKQDSNEYETEAYALNHELAHIAANLPFYGNFKENSLLVHFDGGASVSNFSAWLFKDGKITRIEAHWNLKRLTSMFNANALVFGSSVPGCRTRTVYREK